MNQEELEGRVKTCVDFLTRALVKTSLKIENQKLTELRDWLSQC